MKRFRLDIVGKLEDHPRLLRAYGRVKGAEVALVLRPLEYTGLLVRIGKDGAQRWTAAGNNLPIDWPRVRARIKVSPLGRRAIVLDGALSMKGFHLKTDAEVGDGEVLSVAVDVENKFAVPIIGDAPGVPATEVDGADAVRAIKRLQTNTGKPGTVTFRGQWAGALVCDEGQPRVELRRKLASYGWLRIESGPDGWTWRFERQEKWFGEADALQGETYATLVQAIDAGVLGALGLVQVACRVKDTRRRQALDRDWAESHPVRTPRATRNPTDRLVEPDDEARPAPKANSRAGTKKTQRSRSRTRKSTTEVGEEPTGTTLRRNSTTPRRSSRKSTSKRSTTRSSTSTAKSPTKTKRSTRSSPATSPKKAPSAESSAPKSATSTGGKRRRSTASAKSAGTKARAKPTPSPDPPAEDAALLAAFSEAVAAALND
ncbi:MAG: hypothetical protein R3F61_11580 [Myxococcota bacterium]